MDIRQTLLAAIHADPADHTAWLALADHLEEEDLAEQGELLRLHLRLTQTLDDPQRRDWESRAQALIASGVVPCVPQLSLSLGKGVVLVASLIPAGRARLGDDPPRARVTISRPFYLGVVPVTQSQWKAIMDSRPAHFPGPERPVEQTNYSDCLEFCTRLSRKCKRTVRLPSEAEWEYACRAGATTAYHSGNEEKDLRRVAVRGEDHTHAVAQMQPNGWGLYDLHGNVWEWCRDAEGDYVEDGSIDPVREMVSSSRICKGGSYGSPNRAGNRIAFMAGGRNDFIGMRAVIEWGSAN